jgi:Protein of unknown function (DUF3592)
VNVHVTPLAVQISNVSGHPAASGRGQVWQLALMVLGLTLVTYELVTATRARQGRMKMLPARGLVIDNVPHWRRHRRSDWSPLVEFTADGATVLSELAAGGRRHTYPLGSAIDVLYDPVEPRRARVADFTIPISGWLISGLLIIFLAVVL